MYTYILKRNLLKWFTDGGPARPTMALIPWERPRIQYLFRVKTWMSEQSLSGAEVLKDEKVFTVHWYHNEVGHNTRKGVAQQWDR